MPEFEASNYFKKETLEPQVLSFESCEIFTSTFFTENPRVTASCVSVGRKNWLLFTPHCNASKNVHIFFVLLAMRTKRLSGKPVGKYWFKLPNTRLTHLRAKLYFYTTEYIRKAEVF